MKVKLTSRKHFPKFLLVIIYLITASAALQAQPSSGSWLNGYWKTIESQKILYHSPYPGHLSALLVRATDGTMKAVWETQPVPEEFSRPEAVFVFMGGLATGKGSHRFYLRIDGGPVVEFTTSENSSRREWSVSHPEGLNLTFRTALVDQFDELFGYFFLTVPSRFLKEGHPLTLELTAEKGGSSDWVMVFEQRLSSWCRLKALPALLNRKPPEQLLLLEISHFDLPAEVEIRVTGTRTERKRLQTGYNELFLLVPPASSTRLIEASVYRGKERIYRAEVTQKPVRPVELWLLPHSHLDIGYSDYQEEVEKKQWQNLQTAIELAEKSKALPPEARFKWNVEQLWHVETYLKQADELQKKRFLEAVKNRSIGLQATLAGILTGLCHPEELLEVTAFARELEAAGFPAITSAMITDIPAYSWSFVPALAMAGVRYLSSGPNYMPMLPDGGDRVGHALKTWGDRPFYWVSPSGEHKILFWMAGRGYSWFHGLNLGNLTVEKKRELLEYLAELEEKNYPYSMVQVRYTVGGDNGPPDPELSQQVALWNSEFLTPRLVIATSEEMFGEFEKRHGSEIPAVRGDFSPYWEDGAASTAKETALNRNLSEKLLQLEVLYSLLQPDEFIKKSDEFYQAWRQVVLFHEHTWGSADSISNPDGENAVKQWEYKKSILERGLELADSLEKTLKEKMRVPEPEKRLRGIALDVINTTSVTRSEIVYIPAELSRGLDLALDEKNRALPSQRLADGSLAVEIKSLQPFSATRIYLKPGGSWRGGRARAAENSLENDWLRLEIDRVSGAVRSLIYKPAGNVELVERAKFSGLNAYLYVPGTDPEKAQPAKLKKITILDSGPLVAALALELEAPGCRDMKTIIRINGINGRVDFINQLDKISVREKESVHLAFPFNMPPSGVRLDLGWGTVNPFFEEIPGACLDFFSIQKTVSFSRPDFTLIWVSPDVPLIEIGDLTDERSVNGFPRVWRKELSPSATIVSYALNNYWHTNYRADQEGEINLRYTLFLERSIEPALLKLKTLEVCQPPAVIPAEEVQIPLPSLLKIEPERVVVTRFKAAASAEQGKNAFVLRLYNVSGQPEMVNVKGLLVAGRKIYLSNLKGEKLAPVELPLKILPWSTVTLRIE
ncbi:MAG: glycosyl hydrolase-related protein [Candidatus Saccharicenans sp.]